MTPVVAPDFARLRVESRKYSLSVTAEIVFEAYLRVEPDHVAVRASCDLFSVVSIDRPSGGLPTFVVNVTGSPKDPELTLRTIARRIEATYDELSAAELVR